MLFNIRNQINDFDQRFFTLSVLVKTLIVSSIFLYFALSRARIPKVRIILSSYMSMPHHTFRAFQNIYTIAKQSQLLNDWFCAPFFSDCFEGKTGDCFEGMTSDCFEGMTSDCFLCTIFQWLFWRKSLNYRKKTMNDLLKVGCFQSRNNM